jgi:hypothetical protein
MVRFSEAIGGSALDEPNLPILAITPERSEFGGMNHLVPAWSRAMSNKEYVRELCAGYSELWALDQLADDLDRRDKRIAALEAKVKEGRGPITSWLVDEMNKVKPLQKRIEALETFIERMINAYPDWRDEYEALEQTDE